MVVVFAASFAGLGLESAFASSVALAGAFVVAAASFVDAGAAWLDYINPLLLENASLDARKNVEQLTVGRGLHLFCFGAAG